MTKLADRAGIHRSTIYAIESNPGSVTLATLEALAGALEIDPRELLAVEGNSIDQNLVQLICAYRALPPAQQAALRRIAASLQAPEAD